MKNIYSEAWQWMFDYLLSGENAEAIFPNGNKCGAQAIASQIIVALWANAGIPRTEPYPDDIELDLYDAHLTEWRSFKLEAERKRFLDFAKLIDSNHESFPYPSSCLVFGHHFNAVMYGFDLFPDGYDFEYRLIGSAANLYDAATAARGGDLVKAMGYMTGAALLASGADLDGALSLAREQIKYARTEIQRSGGEKRHSKTEPLKKWIFETVSSRHMQTPFNSRAEAVRDIEEDVIAEITKQKLPLPENLREFIDRALKKYNFIIGASSS